MLLLLLSLAHTTAILSRVDTALSHLIGIDLNELDLAMKAGRETLRRVTTSSVLAFLSSPASFPSPRCLPIFAFLPPFSRERTLPSLPTPTSFSHLPLFPSTLLLASACLLVFFLARLFSRGRRSLFPVESQLECLLSLGPTLLLLLLRR